MIQHSMPMVEVRKKLTSLPEEFDKNLDEVAITVTRRGRPVLAIMPWEFYEALTETMEIMSDKALMKHLRKSIKELEEGKTIAWEKAKKKLDL
jgi:antitoxin YefM